jgi:diadenosine tetraphosphate (Ap4A) HIT family hydrolase
VAFLAEAEGFEHLHIHVVPRAQDMPPERRGKRVFDWLDAPEEEAITDEGADRIALELRPLIAREMSS